MFYNIGMRSSCSFKKNQLSSLANTHSMVFKSYLQKDYDRNHQSSLDAYNLTISSSCVDGKLPGCITPCSAHFSCTPTCHSPHCVQNSHDAPPPMIPHGKCVTLLNNCLIFYLTAKPMCHIIQKPPIHIHPKIF